MDPEEALNTIWKGFKGFVKKTQKVFRNVENRCKDMVNNNDVEDLS